MASYSFLLIILFLYIIHVDSRRRSQELRIRDLWEKISNKVKTQTINRFHFDKEDMLLFPDVAYESLDNNNTWKIMVHGWRYEGNKGRDWLGFSATRWVERIAKNLLNPDAVLYLNGSINRDRLRPFFVADDSNELIEIKIGGKTHLLRTDNHGQFYDRIEITNDEIQILKQQQQQTDDIITYEAIGDNHDKQKGIIRLIEPRQGISIISDIDDTIKVSEVLDKVRLLANTFIHSFIPVPGKYNK